MAWCPPRTPAPMRTSCHARAASWLSPRPTTPTSRNRTASPTKFGASSANGAGPRRILESVPVHELFDGLAGLGVLRAGAPNGLVHVTHRYDGKRPSVGWDPEVLAGGGDPVPF